MTKTLDVKSNNYHGLDGCRIDSDGSLLGSVFFFCIDYITRVFKAFTLSLLQKLEKVQLGLQSEKRKYDTLMETYAAKIAEQRRRSSLLMAFQVRIMVVQMYFMVRKTKRGACSALFSGLPFFLFICWLL